jgi:hypothetical protein
VYGTKGTFNESIISDHLIPKVLVNFKNQKCLQRLNLIFDQAPCHTTSRAKASFNNASVNLNWVPKRMTSILQPADVACMRPLKVAYFKKWNDWLINAPISYSQAGNRKSPGYALVVDWISEIWQELDQATIIRSFDQCGITTQNMANYGSQLRHFVRSNELVENVNLTDEANHEIFEHGDGSSRRPEDDLELLDSDESENA